MTTRLRPHHLLCMLTFAGKGYTPAFVKNFEEVVRRISTGHETVEIVEGPDDVCAPLLAESDRHCNSVNVAVRDRHAAEAISNLLRRPIQPKEQVFLDQEILCTLREAFAAGSIRRACIDCQWAPLCDVIAQNRFTGTQLLNEGNPVIMTEKVYQIFPARSHPH
jgi:uncharacterized protein